MGYLDDLWEKWPNCLKKKIRIIKAKSSNAINLNIIREEIFFFYSKVKKNINNNQCCDESGLIEPRHNCYNESDVTYNAHNVSLFF